MMDVDRMSGLNMRQACLLASAYNFHDLEPADDV